MFGEIKCLVMLRNSTVNWWSSEETVSWMSEKSVISTNWDKSFLSMTLVQLTPMLINDRFLQGISVTYGTRATGSHMQHQRGSVGLDGRPWLPSKATAAICSGVFSTPVKKTGAARFWNKAKHFAKTFRVKRFCHLDHTNWPRGNKEGQRAAACCVRNIKDLAKLAGLRRDFKKRSHSEGKEMEIKECSGYK